jgi:voltage-gated sodium channel
MAAIFLNTVVIFLLYFPAYKDVFILELIDHLFILFFVTEIVVKLNVMKPKAYFGASWNRFDFIIIMASLPSLLVHFVELPNASLIIILRLFRLVRLIRFIRFVPHIDKIMSGLGRALKASLFVLLALVFLNLLFALFTCHFFQNMAPEYFGNPLIAAYSIFQLFTVEGWYEIPAAIAENSTMENDLLLGLTRLYFVMIVLGGIFGLSFANAVFVDEMTMDNTDAIEAKIDNLQEQVRKLHELLEKRNQGG